MLFMFYIIICVFKIIGICIDYNCYCLPSNKKQIKIYFKVIRVLFIGEIFKTAANISFISFSLSRYIKITFLRVIFLLKIDKLNK